MIRGRQTLGFGSNQVLENFSEIKKVNPNSTGSHFQQVNVSIPLPRYQLHVVKNGEKIFSGGDIDGSHP